MDSSILALAVSASSSLVPVATRRYLNLSGVSSLDLSRNLSSSSASIDGSSSSIIT